jgi:hypothetical protein
MATNQYDILSEYTDDKDPDSISVSPYWAIAIVRFAQPLTFSRRKMFDGESSVSYDSSKEALIKERSMIVLTDDVLQMQISHTKGNYISNLTATLMNGDLNYLTEIQPTDWVLAWVVNDKNKGEKLAERILKREACNKFDDGLKFIGRVQSIRKNLQQSADGHRTVRYNLQAAGFKEFDASIFYDPALAQDQQSLGEFLTKQGIDLDDVFEGATTNAMGITTTKILPVLMKIFVGEGLSGDIANPGNAGVQIATGAVSTPEAPYSYAIPESVAKLLGKADKKKKVRSYADIVELLLGIQKYKGGETPSQIFAPDGDGGASNFRILNKDLLGSFLPMPIAFSGKSLWAFMEEFKNPAVNEMYTCLRVNPAGNVVPTVVVRQLPFSSPYAIQKSKLKLTGMLELPRWVGAPILISSLDIGKTDALHVNFVHVFGQAVADGGVDLTLQLMGNAPLRDEQDIKRAGLRPWMQTVACTIADTLEEPRKWMDIVTDFMVGQQYTLNGTCNMLGISAPICPGDNFEFDDTVFQIESVTHTCSVDQSRKTFQTSLSLSHGIRAEGLNLRDNQTSKIATTDTKTDEELNRELLIYTGVLAEDNLGYDPGQTVEGSGVRIAQRLDPSSEDISDEWGLDLTDEGNK